MINKQSLWFLTLFSLILVLSVYYITMPNELLLTNNSKYGTSEIDESNVVIQESEILTAMRVNLDEERMSIIEELEGNLTNGEMTIEEKNNAYDQIKVLTELKGKEEKLEAKIKAQYKLDSFVKIDNNQIKAVVVSKEHNSQLANNIMRTIQEEYQDKMYITVKFEK